MPSETTNKSQHVGPIIMANDTARRQLVEHGVVVTFRASERTTGETWWRESRTGPKQGDCTVERIGAVDPSERSALRPSQPLSGFASVRDWQDAIESLHGGLDEGVLYRVTGR